MMEIIWGIQHIPPGRFICWLDGAGEPRCALKIGHGPSRMLYDEFLHLPAAPPAPAHNLGMFSGQHDQGFIKSVDVRRCQITDGIGKFQQQRLWCTGQLVIHAHEGVRGVQGDRAVFGTKPAFDMERRPRMVHFILGKTARVLRGACPTSLSRSLDVY
jgi:hypothetical protein